MSERTCIVTGCGKPGRRPWCAMHEARLRRTGSLELRARQPKMSMSTSGYRTISGDYEHRIVLRAVIGDAPHPCHWCNRMLAWGVDLHVDHVDRNKLNNDPHNLVPTCQPCNNRRTRHWAHGMTNCKRGHEFTPENTYRNGAGFRTCRACSRLSKQRYKAKLRGRRAA